MTRERQIDQLCRDEQAFWDDVYAEHLEEQAAGMFPGDHPTRWEVRPIPSEHRPFLVGTGVVAGIWSEDGTRGDVDYVKRLVEDEWSLVPTHHLDGE